MDEKLKTEYAIDNNKLLILDADYNQRVFISLTQSPDGNIKPKLEYRGKNRRIGKNIKQNVSDLMSLKPTENGIEVYIGRQRFAGFCLKEGHYVIDESIPQEHLTAFEMRLLARPGGQVGIPFPRNIPKEMAPITDLHTHFAGSASPEGLFELGLKHNIIVPAELVKKLKIKKDHLIKDNKSGGYFLSSFEYDETAKETLLDALRIPKEDQETFRKMEEIYAIRGLFTKNPKLFPDLLMLVGKELAEKGVKYTEMSLSSVISDTNVLKTITEELPKVEKETGCRMRFLAALWRHSDKEWNQDEVDRIKTVAKNPYVVGIDVMGHETNSTTEFGPEIKEVALWAMENDPNFCIRVHAGENPLFRNNVKDVLKIMDQARSEYAAQKGVDENTVAFPQIRIGHGLYGVDKETLALCRKTGAIVEFNMSSNMALNNINFIKEVPIREYIQHGVPFVLGSDGQGIYSTFAVQEMVLASAAGVSLDAFKKMRETEQHIIEVEQKNFTRKQQQMQSTILSGHRFEDIFHAAYSTETGLPRFSDEITKRHAQEKAQMLARVHSQLSSLGIETDPQKVMDVMRDKLPILITGASSRTWKDISEQDQKNIGKVMRALVNLIDPKKAYLLTGGANLGVEREAHIAAHNRNTKTADQLAVVGTLTERVAYQERSQIDKDTITHAVFLNMENGRPARSWFDLPDTVLPYVMLNGGEVIAIGGGGVVRDMIQRAYNMNMNLNLMEGPAGASTDEAETMPECKFKGSEDLIKNIYGHHPDVFVPGFDIKKLPQYLSVIENERANDSKSMLNALQSRIKVSLATKNKQTIIPSPSAGKDDI